MTTPSSSKYKILDLVSNTGMGDEDIAAETASTKTLNYMIDFYELTKGAFTRQLISLIAPGYHLRPSAMVQANVWVFYATRGTKRFLRSLV